MRSVLTAVTVFAVVTMALLTAACGPTVQGPGPAIEPMPPMLRGGNFRTADGVELAVDAWHAEEPRAVIIALHGMNDYANAFAMPGPWWAGQGITTYAYDQRGFGRSSGAGIWPGDERLVDDLSVFTGLIKAVYPDVPVYLLGVSMGGAVVMAAAADRNLGVDGMILVAPAVWGWTTQPFFYRAALWFAAHLFPAKSFTGEGLEIWPSDNIEMLRAFVNDPLVIKETRSDAIYGLVTLMDRAYHAAPRIREPVLLLYGDKDEIIPRGPVQAVALSLCAPSVRMAAYPEGYHMLLRDLSAQAVWRDIAAWTEEPGRHLPSGSGISRSVYGAVADCG